MEYWPFDETAAGLSILLPRVFRKPGQRKRPHHRHRCCSLVSASTGAHGPGTSDVILYQRLARSGSHQLDSSDEDVSVCSWADTADGSDSDSTDPADDDAPGVVRASSDSPGASIRAGTGSSAAIISSVIVATNTCWTVRCTDAMACQFLKTLLSRSMSSNRRRSKATLQGLMHGC